MTKKEKTKALNATLTLLSDSELSEQIKETVAKLALYEAGEHEQIDARQAQNIVLGTSSAEKRTVKRKGRTFNLVSNTESGQILPKSAVLDAILESMPSGDEENEEISKNNNNDDMLNSILNLLDKDKNKSAQTVGAQLREKGIIPLWEQLSVHQNGREMSNIDKALLLADMRRGFEEKEFLYFYQPQWDLQTGALACLESRLRWRHPNKGILGTDFFLTLFEESNMLDDLLSLLFEQLLTDRAQLALNGIEDVKLAVNFSPEQLEIPYLAESMLNALEKMNINPNRIECEITDRQFPKHPSALRDNLSLLSENGVTLCIDNFGAGYSAYPFLQEFTFDKIKLDKSYVAHLFHNPNEQLIVKSVVHQAHLFNAKAVVAGVNSEQMASWLKGIGCDLGQGCYLGTPKPLEEMIDFLKELNTIKARTGESVESLWRQMARPNLQEDASCIDKE